ncbi:MAG: antibiotic biosynthesis monooxygenase family protein [Acidimicrobiales bacterium]
MRVTAVAYDHQPGACVRRPLRRQRDATGERMSLVIFDTIAHHEAWRDDPEHRLAQQRGCDVFYREYTISVCSEIRRRHFRSTEAVSVEGGC